MWQTLDVQMLFTSDFGLSYEGQQEFLQIFAMVYWVAMGLCLGQ